MWWLGFEAIHELVCTCEINLIYNVNGSVDHRIEDPYQQSKNT